MPRTFLPLAFTVSCLCCAFSGEPARGAIRISDDISTGWQFLRQDAAGAESPDYEAVSGWQNVDLPHTWNTKDTFDDVPGYYRGIGWYRKQLAVPESWQGKRIVLHFEAACMVATVWLNGELLGEHRGSYLPFEFDVTRIVKPGGRNLVAVRVDNRWYRDVPTLDRDFNVMGGLHREVRLIATDPVYIVSTRVSTPKVSESEGVAAMDIEVRNEGKTPEKCEVVTDVSGPELSEPITVASTPTELRPGESVRIKQKTKPISRPKLWSPDEPNLYRVSFRLRVNGRVVDEDESPLGFRWYRFDPDKGFFLNGKHLKLRGVNRHDDYPGLGWALPKSRHVEDIKLIKSMGANFIRTAHYPQHPIVLDTCDKLGLLVWEEVPFDGDGLRKGLALGAEDFARNLQRDLRSMIARDRNHPSIILWSLGNENLYGPTAAARAAVLDLTRKLHAIAHQEDPSRLTTVAIDTPRHKLADEIGFTDVVDVVGYNIYAGWYGSHGERCDDLLPILDGFRRRHPNKSLIVSEYGADMERGRHTDSPRHLDISEEYGCRLHEFYWRAIDARPFVAGGLLWNVFDFGAEDRGKDQTIPHLNQKGCFTYDRQPKDVYYFYRSQWTTDPMVYIVSHTWTQRKPGPTPIRVYSNCDSVELSLNGKSLGTRDRSETYVWDVPLAAGDNELRANGSCNGKSVVDTIHMRCE
jgi:beta-galactosidase